MKVGIVVVAYNAQRTLYDVLDRIPPPFRSVIAEVLVQDDFSQDETYSVALEFQRTEPTVPVKVVRHPHNLGYGGNQKAGYRYAIDHNWDVAVLLHGDGQYAPELLPDLVQPILDHTADVVLGSRMLRPGAARAGGMPLYKYLGNRVLTLFQNAVAHMDLSEWHSGYRAYRVSALSRIPFALNSDGFNFDTQILLQLQDANQRIVEVPIPTYYGDEICYVNGLKYARDVTIDTVRHRLGRSGFGSGHLGSVRASAGYQAKYSPDSSHEQVVRWMSRRKNSRVLDLGCSNGQLGARLRAHGHLVTGIDIANVDGAQGNLDAYVSADISQGIPEELGVFDVIIAADVIEHLAEPDRLLKSIPSHLDEGGVALVSVPNISHWYPRARVAFGRFDYDQRGILDRTHLRFFTRSSFYALAARCQLDVCSESSTGLPLEALDLDEHSPAWISSVVRVGDSIGLAVWPDLFSYQFIFEVRPANRGRPRIAPYEWENTDQQ
jgi:glycosyltransferase involved in cell wall biosynthesis